MQHTLKGALATGALALPLGLAQAQEIAPLNSDSEPDRMDWSKHEAKSGALPVPAAGRKVGGVSKTLTNDYWRSLGQGYQNVADKPGLTFACQAAQNEDDQIGQLSIAEDLIAQGFGALLFSPQTDAILAPAVEKAKAAGIPVLKVNDAVLPTAEHYVGMRVAPWFIDNRAGGKVAVIEGQPGVYAAGQRTAGFTETIKANGKFELVAAVPANWSREEAYNAAATILQQYPDLTGFYANNDGMALGVVEAVKAAGKADQVAVFGTDGISDAYAAIKAGDLNGTVDSFPILTGEVAMEVALRLVAGQDLPRAVATPQALITKDNIDTFSTSDQAALRAALIAKEGRGPAFSRAGLFPKGRCHETSLPHRRREGLRRAQGPARRRSLRPTRRGPWPAWRGWRGQVDAAQHPLGRLAPPCRGACHRRGAQGDHQPQIRHRSRDRHDPSRACASARAFRGTEHLPRRQSPARPLHRPQGARGRSAPLDPTIDVTAQVKSLRVAGRQLV